MNDEDDRFMVLDTVVEKVLRDLARKMKERSKEAPPPNTEEGEMDDQ